MRRASILSLVVGSTISSLAAGAPESLPIREVTVFKDGHALVLRSGIAPTNDLGDVVLADLPRPVLGTFWAYESGDASELHSVRAATRLEQFERAPATVGELIEANIGARIEFDWGPSAVRREGVIRAVLRPEPVSEISPVGVAPASYSSSGSSFEARSRTTRVAEGPKAVLLTLDNAQTLAAPLSSLSRVAFIDANPADAVLVEERQADRLTLDLEWEGEAEDSAPVGLMYVQRGLRWIPSYRVTMVSPSVARVELQATLINELGDLQDATTHLVIGAPRFQFEHTPDPMALHDTLAQLGPFFQTGQTGQAMSVALQTQMTRMGESRHVAGGTSGEAVPNLGESERAEDLYIFTVDSISLGEGERLTIPLATVEVPFEAVYTLELLVSPPSSTQQQFNNAQQRELAELMARPRVRHTLRLENTGSHPFTTSPALVVNEDGMPLAQGMMTYTPAGASVDLEVTDAMDIAVTTSHEEVDQELNAEQLNGRSFNRISMKSGATLTNHKPHPVRLEIRAWAPGRVTSASSGPDLTPVNIHLDSALTDGAMGRWWNWPWWWSSLNGATRVEWSIDLPSADSTELTWSWQYLWTR